MEIAFKTNFVGVFALLLDLHNSFSESGDEGTQKDGGFHSRRIFPLSVLIVRLLAETDGYFPFNRFKAHL